MVHLGGVCVSLHNGLRAFLGGIACTVVSGPSRAQPRHRRGSVIHEG